VNAAAVAGRLGADQAQRDRERRARRHGIRWAAGRALAGTRRSDSSSAASITAAPLPPPPGDIDAAEFLPRSSHDKNASRATWPR